MQALLLTSSEQCPLPVVPLAPGSGLVLLPLTDEIIASAADDRPVTGFYELTSGVAEWARQWSARGPVAYLHTEFFGGSGFHAAMAWRDGAVAWGPLFTATSAGEGEEHYTVVADPHDMAVNELLRSLGVERGDHFDEYTAAGLDRCRWTEEWAALTPGAPPRAG
jgi:hypothetical protein